MEAAALYLFQDMEPGRRNVVMAIRRKWTDWAAKGRAERKGHARSAWLSIIKTPSIPEGTQVISNPLTTVLCHRWEDWSSTHWMPGTYFFCLFVCFQSSFGKGKRKLIQDSFRNLTSLVDCLFSAGTLPICPSYTKMTVEYYFTNQKWNSKISIIFHVTLGKDIIVMTEL